MVKNQQISKETLWETFGKPEELLDKTTFKRMTFKEKARKRDGAESGVTGFKKSAHPPEICTFVYVAQGLNLARG